MKIRGRIRAEGREDSAFRLLLRLSLPATFPSRVLDPVAVGPLVTPDHRRQMLLSALSEHQQASTRTANEQVSLPQVAFSNQGLNSTITTGPATQKTASVGDHLGPAGLGVTNKRETDSRVLSHSQVESVPQHVSRLLQQCIMVLGVRLCLNQFLKPGIKLKVYLAIYNQE